MKLTGPSPDSAGDHPRVREDGAHGPGVEVLVLRRERVERGRDQHHLAAGRERGDVSLPREDERIDRLEVRREEGPAALDLLVRRVAADVAAPDRADPGALKVRREAGRLRVVQDHDVARADVREHARGVLPGDLLVDGALGDAERAPVAGGAVQGVVQPLGQAEERRDALDHQPARLDAEVARVADQRGQHLRDAAAGRRGVDVPDGAAGEALAQRRRTIAGGRDRLRADHALEQTERARRDCYLVRLDHAGDAPLPGPAVPAVSPPLRHPPVRRSPARPLTRNSTRATAARTRLPPARTGCYGPLWWRLPGHDDCHPFR